MLEDRDGAVLSGRNRKHLLQHAQEMEYTAEKIEHIADTYRNDTTVKRFPWKDDYINWRFRKAQILTTSSQRVVRSLEAVAYDQSIDPAIVDACRENTNELLLRLEEIESLDAFHEQFEG
jgi:hypothetical protein